MKKGKMLYLFPLAALLLSGCSFAEVKHSIGSSWVGEHILHPVYDPIKNLINGDDKKEEQKACEHADENHDHKCDFCGEEMSQHADANNDFKCDVCGAELATAKVELDLSKAITQFALGEEFTSQGVKVIATSEVGSTKELEATFSEPDMSTVGEKTVVVTYGSGENDKKEYTINVSYWSREDLEVFEAGSFTSAAPLPYLAGFNMRTEAEWEGEGEDKELVSWRIVADDITSEGVMDYYNKMLAYDESYVVPAESEDEEDEVVYMLLDEVGIDADGYHGLTDVSVFVMHPSYLTFEENEDGSVDEYAERLYRYDEYIITGVNEDGQFVIENRYVDALLDGYIEYYIGFSFCDGWNDRILPAKYNYYIELLPIIVGYYYSELSEDAFILPAIEGEDVAVQILSLSTLYPLDESLDAYAAPWELYMEGEGLTEELMSAFYSSLTEFGYTHEESPAEGVELFTLEDDFYGSFEIYSEYEVVELTDGSKLPILTLEYLYTAPESYTNHLDFMAEALVNVLFNGNGEYFNDLYEYFSVVVGYGLIDAEGYANGGELAYDLARMLVNSGYEVYSPIEFVDPSAEDEDPEEPSRSLREEPIAQDEEGLGESEEGEEELEETPYYEFDVISKDYEITFLVDAGASVDEESGDSFYYVEFYLYDGAKFELSKGEIELQEIYAAFAGFKPVFGSDYVMDEVEEGEDPSFSTVLTMVDADASDEGRQAVAEGTAQYLAESYVLASSEAGESSYNATFYDVERGLIVSVDVVAVEGKGYVLSASVIEHKFITPESTMVEFLTALNGAEPQEGAYAVDEETGACLAQLSVEGSHEESELQNIAEGFETSLPEGFTEVSSAAGEEGSWVVLAQNEAADIQATFTVVLGEEGAVSATALIEPIPHMGLDEFAIKAILEAMWGEEAVAGEDYSYDEEDGVWRAGLYAISSATSASYAQQLATSIKGIADSAIEGSELEVFQGAAVDYSQYYGDGATGYRMICVDWTSGLVVDITVFFYPAAGFCVYSLTTYLLG